MQLKVTRAHLFRSTASKDPYFSQVWHYQAFYDKALEPWLLVMEDGALLAAHCICKVGMGRHSPTIGSAFLQKKICSKATGWQNLHR